MNPSRPRPPAAGPLIGREPELAALADELRRSADGEFRLVLLLGDAGVGKTRLAGEVRAGSGETHICMAARAHALGSTSSFGVWAEACEGYLRTLPAEHVRRLCRGFDEDLAGLLHSVAAGRGGAPPGQVPRSRLLESLTVLFEELTRERPVLVFLDDVHVADDSSWDALHYLARNLSDAPLTILATARPTELQERGAIYHLVLNLEEDGLVSRVGLDPLSTDQVRGLTASVLGTDPPPTLIEWLAGRAQGNPLFTLGLLRALLDADADLAAPELSQIPEALADRVLARTARFEETARIALEVLAVAGRPLRTDDLSAMMSVPAGGIGAALDDLQRARLVRLDETTTAGQVRYEITHPLIQEVLYQQLGPSRRRFRHRTVGRVLLADGRLGEAAPHFALSAEVGDIEAIEALSGAVRVAEAGGLYRDVLELLGGLVPIIPAGDPHWVELVDDMVLQASWVVDHRADVHATLAIPALRVIDTMLDSGGNDPSRRAAIKFRLASFLGWGDGAFEEADRLLGEALDLYGQAGDENAQWLTMLEIAYLRGFAGSPASWLDTGRRVAALAEAAGDRYVHMQALGRGVAWVAYQIGEFATAEDAFLRSSELARQERRPYFESLTLGGLAYTMALSGRMTEAAEWMQRAKAADPDWRESVHLEFEIIIHWLVGDFGAAVEQARESVRWNYRGIPRRRALGLVFAALAAVELDQVSEAEQLVRVAEAAYGGRQWFTDHLVAEHAAAVLAWRTGDRAGALARMRAAAEGTLAVGGRPWAAFLLLDLCELALEFRQADPLAWAAGQLTELASVLEPDLYRHLALIGHAALDALTGAGHTKSDELAAAAESLSAAGYPALSGRALDVAGHLTARREPNAAQEFFDSAAAVFADCRATWRRERALAAARRVKPGRGRRPGTAGLTARELDVARLVARGMSAQEVAAELFIGVRTVETHVARIYTKLGVGSKFELMRRADELLPEISTDTDSAAPTDP